MGSALRESIFYTIENGRWTEKRSFEPIKDPEHRISKDSKSLGSIRSEFGDKVVSVMVPMLQDFFKNTLPKDFDFLTPEEQESILDNFIAGLPPEQQTDIDEILQAALKETKWHSLEAIQSEFRKIPVGLEETIKLPDVDLKEVATWFDSLKPTYQMAFLLPKGLGLKEIEQVYGKTVADKIVEDLTYFNFYEDKKLSLEEYLSEHPLPGITFQNLDKQTQESIIEAYRNQKATETIPAREKESWKPMYVPQVLLPALTSYIDTLAQGGVPIEYESKILRSDNFRRAMYRIAQKLSGTIQYFPSDDIYRLTFGAQDMESVKQELFRQLKNKVTHSEFTIDDREQDNNVLWVKSQSDLGVLSVKPEYYEKVMEERNRLAKELGLKYPESQPESDELVAPSEPSAEEKISQILNASEVENITTNERGTIKPRSKQFDISEGFVRVNTIRGTKRWPIDQIKIISGR